MPTQKSTETQPSTLCHPPTSIHLPFGFAIKLLELEYAWVPTLAKAVRGAKARAEPRRTVESMAVIFISESFKELCVGGTKR